MTNSRALLLHSSSEENPTGNFCFQSVIHSGRYSKIFKEELLNGFYLTGLLCDFFLFTSTRLKKTIPYRNNPIKFHNVPQRSRFNFYYRPFTTDLLLQTMEKVMFITHFFLQKSTNVHFQVK